jgi:hypothetical protein
MLFTPGKEKSYTGPIIGAPVYLDDFLREKSKDRWPLEPMELVDGVPFLIVYGYISGGPLERGVGKEFVDWFAKHWRWTEVKYGPRTVMQKEAALEKLFRSKRWLEPLTAHDKEFLAFQTK